MAENFKNEILKRNNNFLVLKSKEVFEICKKKISIETIVQRARAVNSVVIWEWGLCKITLSPPPINLKNC